MKNQTIGAILYLISCLPAFAFEPEIEIIKNNTFDSASSWTFNDANGASRIQITDDRYDGALAVSILSTMYSGKGIIMQAPPFALRKGETLKLSGFYKTKGYLAGEKPAFYVTADYNYDQSEGKAWQKQNLTPQKEWTYFEKIISLTHDAKNVRLSMTAQNFTGEVCFAKPSLQVVKKRSIVNTNEIYIWREGEDVSKMSVCSTWKPEVEKSNDTYFSGRGAAFGNAKNKFQWSFTLKTENDPNQVDAKSRTYFIWYRLYGYRSTNAMATEYNKKILFSFAVSNTEWVDAGGNYLGGGGFYWQYGGSFVAKGGSRNDLKLVGEKSLVDAVLLTTDRAYQPLGYEARAQGAGAFAKDLFGEYIFKKEFMDDGISDKITSVVCLRMVSSAAKSIFITGKPAVLHVRLPKEIQLVNVSSWQAGTQWHSSNWQDKYLVFKKIGEKNLNGQMMVDFEVYYHYIGTYDLSALIVKADPALYKPQAHYTGEFWFEYLNSVQTPEKIEFHGVAMEPTKAFSNIFIGPTGAIPSLFIDIPNVTDLLQHAGINMMNPFHVEHRERFPELWNKLLADAKGKRILVFGQHSPFLEPFAAEGDEQAIDLAGKIVHKPALWIGENEISLKRNAAAIASHSQFGLSGMSMDDEQYNVAGDTIDYHPKTISQFKFFLQHEHPDLVYKDPKEIIKKNNLDDQALYASWVRFKAIKTAERYREFRKAYESTFTGSSTFGAKYFIPVLATKNTIQETINLQYVDVKLLANHCTHISHMIYTFDQAIPSSSRIGDIVRMNSEYLGKDIFTPTLLLGDFVGEIPLLQKKAITYQLLEALMNKAKGIFYWQPYAFFNVLNLKQISDGVRMLQPYEDILLSGDYCHDMQSKQKWARVVSLRHGNRLLLYVANYHNDESEMAVITFDKPIRKGLDLNRAAPIPINDGKLTVDFSSDRGRLFFIEQQE